MAAIPMMSQKAYKEHLAFAEKHPEWTKRALAVVNRWGTGEVTLNQSITEALIQAYEDGKNKVQVEGVVRAATIRRRTR